MIFFPSNTTGQTKPIGSYRELMADRIPSLVAGLSGLKTSNWKTSFSTLHRTPSALSIGNSSLTVGRARLSSGMIAKTSRLLLTNLVRRNPPFSSRAINSCANEIALLGVFTAFNRSSTQKSSWKDLTASLLKIFLLSSAVLFQAVVCAARRIFRAKNMRDHLVLLGGKSASSHHKKQRAVASSAGTFT